MRTVEFFQAAAPIALALGILIVVSERRLVRKLREKGAVSATTAAPLPGLNFMARWRLSRLRSQGALRMAATNTLYLDEAGYARVRSSRRRRALTAVAVSLAAVLAVMYFSH